MNEILILVVVSFASGLLFPAFHAIIGAPKSVPDENAGLGAQFVTTLKITKPGMIFREYGKWLCERQNQWELENDKSLLYYANCGDGHGVFIEGSIETSYNREGLTISSVSNLPKGILKGNLAPRYTSYYVRLLPGEVAKFKFRKGAVGPEIQEYLLPFFPNFNRSKMPLSIYKALGLCGLCTTFWILALNITICISFGLFSASIFWLIGPAYGIAAWASTLYEI